MRLQALACAALLSLSAAALSVEAFGAEGVELEPANNNIANVPSLQRGAKYFVNYCLGCHSAQYVRYSRLAEGLLLSKEQLVDNLMFTGEQPFDTMSNAMRSADAERWFGKAPPDLSLIARSRGTDYIYNYLRGFYVDEARPTGANNIVLPNTAMPDVLWELQGIRRPLYGEEGSGEGTGSGEDTNENDAGAAGSDETADAPAASGAGSAAAAAAAAADDEGEENADEGEQNKGEITGFEVVKEGLMTEPEFDQVARDIVNFLDYIGEPIRVERERLGLRVIGFLLVFLLVAYLLKKEIWKDVA
jgi:ubiquinol-cytochrome c reductase cytochrome c1 subunit